MDDLKEAINDKNLTIGTERTIKRLRSGELKKIFLAKNCPLNTKNTIKRYSKIVNVEVVELNVKNDELGAICKKLFSISVLGC